MKQGIRSRPPEEEAVASRRRVLWIALALGLSTFLVYLPALSCQFLNLDDDIYVTGNRHARTGITAENVLWAFTSAESSNYWHPLTWLSHMLDVELFGLKPWGHHLTSVLLHAANTVLLFLVLCGLNGRRSHVSGRTSGPSDLATSLWPSAFAAALFGLHPLHVESVAWVAERKDVLSTLFWLLTLWAYAGYARVKLETGNWKLAGAEPQTPLHSTFKFRVSSFKWYFLTLVFFILGLMSKPMLVTVPFVLLLLDWWPLGRMRKLETGNWKLGAGREPAQQGAGGASHGRGRLEFPVSSFQFLLLEKLPFFALAGLMTVWVFQTQRAGQALASLAQMPLRIRAANALISCAAYLAKTLWPVNLSVVYPHPEHEVSYGLAAVSGVVLLLITAFAVAAARRRPYLAMGWLWYLGTLAPVIGIVQIGTFARADRFTYVPLIGVFMMVAWGLAELGNWKLATGNWNSQTRGAPASSAPSFKFQISSFNLLAPSAILLACAVLTWRQVGYWKDGITLFTHALRVTRNNYTAHGALGEELAAKGRFAEAMEQFSAALRLNPNLANTHYNVGFLLARQGRVDEAIAAYTRALQLDPRLKRAHYNLGVFLAQQGRAEEAAAHYRAELDVNPGSALAHTNLGNILLQQGRTDEAIGHYREALSLDPGLAAAHYNLGGALEAGGQADAALEHYAEAVRLDPRMAAARIGLALALANRGQGELALVHFTEALRLDAGSAEAHYGLGRLLAAEGRTEEATQHYREVVRLSPEWLEVLNNLAWILATDPRAEVRDGREALDLARRAVDLTDAAHPVPLDTLGAAHAELGQFADAAAAAEQALALARSGGDAALTQAIGERLALYRQRRPYRASGR